MVKSLEHRSVVKNTEVPKTTTRELSRRQFFRLGIAGTALVAALQGGIIGSLVSAPRTAHAQDSVKDLKSISVKAIKELDSKMDKSFQRDFWKADAKGQPVSDSDEKKAVSYCSTAKIDDSNSGVGGIYLNVTTVTNKDTLDKKISIEIPADKTKPNGPKVYSEVNLQKLHDFYVEACIVAGCTTKDKLWVKITFSIDTKGVSMYFSFVDSKPKAGDASDLKDGYPVLGCRFDKGLNGVSKKEWYYRLEDPERVARRDTR